MVGVRTGTLVLSTFLVAATMTAGQSSNVELRLPSEFELATATALVGDLGFDPATLEDPTVVGARRLLLPAGTLVVCPRGPPQAGEGPDVPLPLPDCPGGTEHEDPVVRFGRFTWLRFEGTHTLTRGANASVNLFFADIAGLRWVAVLSPGVLGLSAPPGELRFAAVRATSEVIVEADGERFYYNGTDDHFLFQGPRSFGLVASGITAGVEREVALRLRNAPVDAVRDALDPGTLLDLQELVLGPDDREPVGNATDLMRTRGRVPHLARAAFLGHLDGRVGAESPDPEDVVLVRLSSFDGAISGLVLSGQADIEFVLGPGDVAGAGLPAVLPLWLLGALLWTAAAVVSRTRGPPARGRRLRAMLDRTAPAVAFLVWDLISGVVLGASGIALLLAGDLASGALLTSFEVVCFGLAWWLLYVPARVVFSRVLPSRWAVLRAPAAAGVLVLYFVLQAAAVLRLGLQVARL